MNRCMCCGQPLQPQHEGHADRVGERVEAMRQWCSDRGVWLGPADDVSEQTAAALLGRAPETLRSWRGTDQRLPFRKSGGRIRYALSDIAAFAMGETVVNR